MYRINYVTIKQYNGTMDFESRHAYDEQFTSLIMDNTVVSVMGYKDGDLINSSVNDSAVVLIKACPVEKGHIGTK